MTHTHSHHAHSHGHGPGEGHHHGPATPHPAQAAPWSILRMALAGRLGAAIAVSAVMWAIVFIAMRPS
jgi:hypothetical protein